MSQEKAFQNVEDREGGIPRLEKGVQSLGARPKLKMVNPSSAVHLTFLRASPITLHGMMEADGAMQG